MTNKYVEYLKDAADVDPATFDPTYELMTTAVRGLSSVLRDSLDLPDLMMLFHLSIHTGKSSVEVKQKKVEESHLTEADKERLKEMIDQALTDVAAGKYSHNSGEDYFGIFGTGTYTLDTPKDDAQRFIGVCIEILDEQDEDRILDVVEAALEDGVFGVGAGIASQILHFLKPTVFPIMNNWGKEKLKQVFEMKIPGDVSRYVPTVRKIREKRNDLFSFKNYIVIDQMDDPDDPEPLVKPEKHRFWKIAPEERARLWKWWLEDGIATIGWGSLGDVSELTEDQFKTRTRELYPGRLGPYQVWTFSRIAIGDIVVANMGQKKIIGVGVVTAPYQYDESGPDDHYHRLGVAWDDQMTAIVNEQGWLRTLLEISPDRARKLIGEWTPPSIPPAARPAPNPEYPLSRLAEETGFDEVELKAWVRAIERKGQAVLYGPPGTGKTFVAERLARHLLGGGTGVTDLVQFHPSYAYEDFIQGIRPETGDGGALTYDLVPGRFRDFCAMAASREGRSVLVIDEINRANLSRVFGELMYLLEYRGRSIPLAGGERLTIPKSVRIIGTMNTADRSIALVDHALRRRFAFLRLPPNFDVLARYHEKTGFHPAGLIETLKEVNRRIGDRNYEIGISFFLRQDIEEHLADIWRMEIEPYLEEFFFDSPKKVDELRWDRVGRSIVG